MADVPIPESVMESVCRTQTNLEELRTNMTQFLATCDVDVLAELTPLQRANAFLTLAKAISTLVSLNLRCNGVNPEDHPVKSELERVSLYEDKLERLVEYNKGPSRPSTTINHQAATRVIGHSLPDLTPDQKQSLLQISRADGHKSRTDENRRARKKRKHHSSEKQSIRAAAQEFLEKAKRELLGEERSFQGPLHGLSSDDEEGKEN
ncbi:Nuclear nucleic acid-binding protein [Nymphaea thermarum]|nr:Nuclear nucleic acid-binding protein [Nymphaea thermarum]